MRSHISESINITAEAVKYMAENNIPMTLANMGIVQNIFKNPYYLADKLNELDDSEVMDLISDSLPDSSSLEFIESDDAESEIYQNLSNALDSAWNLSENHETLSKINNLQKIIRIQNFTPKTNRLDFKLPINFGGKIAELNMYVLNSGKDFNDGISFLISLKTENLGEIKMTVLAEGDDVKATVISENKASINHLIQEKGNLEELLTSAGFELSELKFKLKETNYFNHNESTKPLFDKQAASSNINAEPFIDIRYADENSHYSNSV
jgi:hypothetical protein